MTQPAKISMTRAELYQLVWSTPMRQLAKEYGLSDVGLAKICTRHGIPKPPVGYWAKKQFGKTVEQTPLPPTDDRSLEIVERAGPGPVAGAPTPTGYFDATVNRIAALWNSGAIHLDVPNRLSSPHPLVKDALEGFKRVFARSPEAAHQPCRCFLPGDRWCLDICVSQALVDRALRIMNTLILALEQCGFEVRRHRQHWRRGIPVLALGNEYDIRFHEHSPAKSTDGRRGSGRLIMVVQDAWSIPRATIRDTDTQRIEEKLDRIIHGILRDADERAKRQHVDPETAARLAEERRIQEEAAERKRQEEERLKQEQTRRDNLWKEAVAWDNCRILRGFLTATRDAVLERFGSIETDGPFYEWLNWGFQVADELDPVLEMLEPNAEAEHADTSEGQTPLEGPPTPVPESAAPPSGGKA